MGIVAYLLHAVNRVKHICNKKFMSTFATRLKELRSSTSQAAFASAIGVNRVQYAKYESGINTPSADILAAICRAHAVSADWLLGLKDCDGSVRAGAGAAVAIGANARATSRTTVAAPGEMPACSKCPHLKKLKKLEALLKK